MDGWLPPLLNDLLKGRHRDAMRIHKACREAVAYAASRQGLPQATSARRVTIEVEFPAGQHAPDVDSLFKSLLDALRHAGLILDDRYELCEIMPVVYRRGPRLRTEVHLEDIPEKVIGPRCDGDA